MSWENEILGALGQEVSKELPALSPPVEVGKVITPPPSLTVEIRGLQLRQDKGDLVVNAALLKGYKRKVEIKLAEPLTHSDSPNHPVILNAEITTTDEINVGDQVMLFPFAGKQKWFVSCKVVTS